MNTRIKIVADNKIPFLKGVFEPYADIEYYDGFYITEEKIKDADALVIRTRTKCNADLLSETNVKLIATATIGYDHIDTKYCDQNNIKWLNAPGCNSSSVMQYVASALLTLAGKLNFELADCTIGVVGVGNVGSKVVKFADNLGMKVLQNDPPRARKESDASFVSLDELIDQSDIITFHVPLNKEGQDRTYHLADEAFFAKLNKGTIIINTSRGSVVKTSALKNAIKDNIISYSVLDVWENEPDIDKDLFSMVNIASPHIAGYSADGKANGTAVCVNAINKYFKLGFEGTWYPSNIPLPDNPTCIKIDTGNLTDQEILNEAISCTYDVLNDDARLRNSLETFERQRGDYPIRREFTSYYIELNNPRPAAAQTLRNLGFNVIENIN